ncbi:MAG: YlxR family protein [Oscillatoriales cyanobacterium SM2_1_8]|nr:YlxR family protein [Oscillatoriales cyanobacterium SM2_1_8]
MAAKDVRRCVSCRRLAPRQEFWRVVRLADSRRVVWDQGDRRAMGRAAYVCPCLPCVAEAQKKRRLERALKTPVPATLWPDLWAQVQGQVGDSPVCNPN